MTTSIYKSLAGEKAVLSIYDAALKNWAVPYETQKIPTRHGETFLISSGDALAPVMILLHGAGGNSSMWAGDVSDFSKGFRVHAVDLVGEAGKSAPNRPTWDSPAFAEWLEDVFNELHIGQATLVGISQGAWTALKFAVGTPKRVEKLVLIAPGGIVPDRASFLPRAILSMLLGKWGITHMVRALFADQPVPTEVINTVMEMTSEFKPRIGVLPIFSDEELRRLTMPTLLLGGTKDIIRDTHKIATRLGDLMPNLRVNIVQGGGHALVQTSGRIMEFLQQTSTVNVP